MCTTHLVASHLSLSYQLSLFSRYLSISSSESLPSLLGARSETSREATVRSNLVGNAGSRPISEAKQPWACPVLGWGTTGEAHVLYSLYYLSISLTPASLRSARAGRGLVRESGQVRERESKLAASSQAIGGGCCWTCCAVGVFDSRQDRETPLLAPYQSLES